MRCESFVKTETPFEQIFQNTLTHISGNKFFQVLKIYELYLVTFSDHVTRICNLFTLQEKKTYENNSINKKETKKKRLDDMHLKQQTATGAKSVT